MASAITHATGRSISEHFRRVLVGFDDGERRWDTLALARRLVDDDGIMRICAPLEERSGRVTIADGDLVVAASAPHGPVGRICLDRHILRVLHRAGIPVAVAPAAYRETGPFRHIGIAVDDSPQAAAALACGYVLAARDGAAVTLVRVLPAIGPGLADERERLRMRLRAHEELDAAADAAPAGVNPEARLLHGDPRSVLPEAFDGPVDLVVCGSHGYGALQRAVLGSVSQALLEGAAQPVLVVRVPVPPAHPEERTT